MLNPINTNPNLEWDASPDFIKIVLPRQGQVANEIELPRLQGIDRSVLIQGDAAEALDLLPESSVQTVVTSPPYWSLRDYAVDDQTGRDESLESYIRRVALVFKGVKRVLTDDGTVWLNIGDSYTSGNRGRRAPDRKNRAREMNFRPRTPLGLKEKDLIGVPWRLAFALQDDGWWVRSEIIWHKPNAHPESVRDRPTKAHETVFLLSKRKRYHYNTGAVTGPGGRRLRSVWEINTEPVQRHNGQCDDHPAMMPMSLALRCIDLTAKPDSVVLDPFAGSGTTLLAAKQRGCNWVGVELKPAFVNLIERRIRVNNHDGSPSKTRSALPSESGIHDENRGCADQLSTGDHQNRGDMAYQIRAFY